MVIVTLGLGIATNTPAFKDYTLQKSIADAQIMAANWHLEQAMITSNGMTLVRSSVTAHGPSSEIVFHRRYLFHFGWQNQWVDFPEFNAWRDDSPIRITGGVARDCMFLFKDLANFYGVVDLKFGTNVPAYDIMVQRWLNASNLLTMDKAEQIAESSIGSIGVSMENMKFKAPARKEQKIQMVNGAMHLLPYYTFDWDTDKGKCSVEVSGISSNIALFYFEGECPQLEFSTNSFELLGFTTNTLFVVETRPGSDRGPVPPYRLFPYPIPLPKNQPLVGYIPMYLPMPPTNK